jgi:hypothetical protein
MLRGNNKQTVNFGQRRARVCDAIRDVGKSSRDEKRGTAFHPKWFLLLHTDEWRVVGMEAMWFKAMLVDWEA